MSDEAGRWGSVGGEAFCYITTKGRISGRPHTIEIWFATHGNSLYLLAGGGHRADWVKNLKREPRLQVRIGGRTFDAQGRLVAGPQEEAHARRLLAAKYQGWKEGTPLSEWAQTALVVAIEPF